MIPKIRERQKQGFQTERKRNLIQWSGCMWMAASRAQAVLPWSFGEAEFCAIPCTIRVKRQYDRNSHDTTFLWRTCETLGHQMSLVQHQVRVGEINYSGTHFYGLKPHRYDDKTVARHTLCSTSMQNDDLSGWHNVGKSQTEVK
eukprot:5134097-Amphidinium_carterae.1